MEHSTLKRQRQWFEEAMRDAKDKADRDVDYYHHQQWTEKEAAILRARGQPVICRNMIRSKVDYPIGLCETNKTDPKVLPRSPRFESEANAATDALRFVMNQEQWEVKRADVYTDLLLAGWGGFEIAYREDPKGENPHITLERCPYYTMYWDSDTKMLDFSDARYLGQRITMDRDEALAIFGEEAKNSLTPDTEPSMSDSFSVDAQECGRIDPNRNRVTITKTWNRDVNGMWSVYYWTKSGILMEQESPWKDAYGNSEHGYVWAFAFLDRQFKPYGIVRGMIDEQDELNKRLSKSLHAINVRQTFSVGDALDFRREDGRDHEHFRNQINRPDGHIRLREGAQWGVDVGIIPTDSVVAGNIQMAQIAESQLEKTGANAALLGKDRRAPSGRAVLANQEGGKIELQNVMRSLYVLEKNVYTKTWNRIRQLWTKEKWFSVTDEEGGLKWVGLNVPQIDPMTGQPTVQNKLAELDVDIIIDRQSHSATLQGERFQALVSLAQFAPEIQLLPAEVWIELADIPNKGQLLRIIRQMRESKQNQAPDPIAQAAQQSEIENKQADTQLKQASAVHKKSQAMLDLRAAGIDPVSMPQASQQATVEPLQNVIPTNQGVKL